MTTEQPQSFRQRVLADRGLLLLVIVAIIGLIAVCIFGILLVRSLLTDNGISLVPGTPTPFASTPIPPANEPLIVGVSESTTVTVTLDVPVSLNVAGQTFSVQTQVIAADGLWSPTIEGQDMAVWVYGTIINYIIGLPDTPANRSLLEEQLAPGSSIILTTRRGTEYTFDFSNRQTVPSNNRDVFVQTRPGITLVLLGAREGERLVVRGDYVVAETTDTGFGNVVSLGETAQLEDVQVTVTGATYVPDRPEAPPGFAFYLVDYQIQNVGLTAVDTSNLQLLLTDDLGNQYALNGPASQLGNYPPLSGFLNAGQTVQATAGYQIPASLVSTNLNWIVARSGSNSRVQVTIPFNAGANVAQGTAVSLQSVTTSADLTSLILVGQITNVGGQPVVVTEGDITLRTEDGAGYLLLSTNPAFPWTVGPGQTTPFSVSFQRPPTADSAVFTVLNQPFQLTGLR